MRGKLVLVVGPSGAGKDTLLAMARERFEGDTRIRFPKRLVTRAADGVSEDHIPIDRSTFTQKLAAGDYALAWEAHGHGYIIPAEVTRMVTGGAIVVCNVSRGILPEAVAKFPDCVVVLVTADADIRARRLAARGRESLTDISSRLTREGAPIPEGIPSIKVDNSGHLAESAERFCAALIAAAQNHITEGATP